MLKYYLVKKGFAALNLLVIFLVIAAVGGTAYYLGTRNLSLKVSLSSPTPQTNKGVVCTQEVKLCPDGTTSVGRVAPNCDFAPCPSPLSAEEPVKTGWLTYKNEQYGFQISYPAKYKALTDKENLYGWPKAVVLIYAGGQSYDLPIEVWNTKAEYEAKYKATSNLTVKEVNGKFITLLNANFDPEVDEIIATFKKL